MVKHFAMELIYRFPLNLNIIKVIYNNSTNKIKSTTTFQPLPKKHAMVHQKIIKLELKNQIIILIVITSVIKTS